MENIQSLLEKGPVFTKAVVCCLVRGDKVLLGLRKKVSDNLGENLISGIGGKLEAGESDEEALIREVCEEIKVRILKYREMGRLRFLFPHKPKWQQDVRVYIVEEWEGEPTETEPIKPEWFNQKELPLEQMWEDNAYWLPKVLKGEKINAVYLYDENVKVIEELIES